MIDSNRYAVIDSNRYAVIDSNRYTVIDSNRYTVIDSIIYIYVPWLTVICIPWLTGIGMPWLTVTDILFLTVTDIPWLTVTGIPWLTVTGMRGTISTCCEKTENMAQSAFPVEETALPVSCGTKPGQQDGDLGTSPLMVVMSRHWLPWRRCRRLQSFVGNERNARSVENEGIPPYNETCSCTWGSSWPTLVKSVSRRRRQTA